MSRDRLLLLDDMIEAAELALSFVAGVDFDAFCANREKVSAVERQIFILGEAAVQLPDEMRDRAPAVPWRGVIGMRNVLAHGYWKSDEETLWDTVKNHVPRLLSEVRRLRGG